MSLYYFHLRTAADIEILDRQGRRLSNDASAEQHAVQSVLDLAWGNQTAWRGCAVDVCRDDQHLMTVFFDEIIARNAQAAMIADRHFVSHASTEQGRHRVDVT